MYPKLTMKNRLKRLVECSFNSLLKFLDPLLPNQAMTVLEKAGLFLVMGAINNLLAYLVYVLSLNLFDFSRSLSLCLAYVFGVLIAHYNFSNFVFKDSKKPSLLRFTLAYISILIINLILLEGIVYLFQISDEISQLLLVPPIAYLSYSLNKHWVFKAKRV